MINTKPVTAVIGSYLFLINLIVGSLYNVNAKPLSNAYLIQSVSIDKDCLSDVNVIDNMRQQKMADAGIMPLQIITDKKVYSLAESITITIKNNGSESLTFPDAALNLKIKNLDTGDSYPLVAIQVLTELNPNESRTFKWNQQEGNAKEGNFSVSTNCGIYSANTSFSITR